MITSRITAPIVALMIEAIMPPPISDAEPRQQPAGDERADDADHDVAEQAEAHALHDQAGEPACDRTDEDDDDELLPRP